MKLYNNIDAAQGEADKDNVFIPKLCPFHVRMSTRTLCGSWCPHFFYDKAEIYITCSGREVCVGVKE